MRNQGAKKNVSVLNILIAVFAVILAISILITASMFRSSSVVYSDREDSLYMYLTYGEYNGLADRYYDYGLTQDRVKKDLMEYYAVGLYYEDIFYAHAYEAAGNAEKAAARYARAESRKAQMGEFVSEADKIDRMFE